ncbi:MAG: thioredoxin 1 TrxA [Algoriphagus marincola HL-49]|uniref:Thioredoxin n=2 Tax=Algoriphagus TaxID=246875 RepID=A0A0P7Y4Z4_9BACT|nr:MAG: thioredoxin 1 TrxA [Algoriphagus marincola HL-49]
MPTLDSKGSAFLLMAKKNPKELIQKSQDAVLVDFYADWCGPCQTMDPIIAEVLDELGGKIKLLKINVDKHPQLAQQFAVRSIPHYALFKRGKILWRKGGIMTKKDLHQSLKAFC